MKKKTIALMMSAVLLFGAAVGGTLAWLTDKTDPITNTFTVGNVDIELSETKGGDKHEFKMVPGGVIEKDPTVTVKGGSEDSYVFIKIEESKDFDTYLSYELDGWKQLTNEETPAVNVDGVYYKEYTSQADDLALNVLKNKQVKVSDTAVVNKIANQTLTFTAYAVQKANVNSAYKAWEIANPVAP